MEEMRKKDNLWRKSSEASVFTLNVLCSQHLYVLSNWKLSEPQCLVLQKLHYIDMIDYIISHYDWVSLCSSSLPGGLGLELKICWLSGNQSPSSMIYLVCINLRMIERDLLWITKDTSLTPLRNPKDFRSSVQEPGTKSNV